MSLFSAIADFFGGGSSTTSNTSSNDNSNTVPADFIGPLMPGQTYVNNNPLEAMDDDNNNHNVVPADFIGPLLPQQSHADDDGSSTVTPLPVDFIGPPTKAQYDAANNNNSSDDDPDPVVAVVVAPPQPAEPIDPGLVAGSDDTGLNTTALTPMGPTRPWKAGEVDDPSVDGSVTVGLDPMDPVPTVLPPIQALPTPTLADVGVEDWQPNRSDTGSDGGSNTASAPVEPEVPDFGTFVEKMPGRTAGSFASTLAWNTLDDLAKAATTNPYAEYAYKVLMSAGVTAANYAAFKAGQDDLVIAMGIDPLAPLGDMLGNATVLLDGSVEYTVPDMAMEAPARIVGAGVGIAAWTTVETQVAATMLGVAESQIVRIGGASIAAAALGTGTVMVAGVALTPAAAAMIIVGAAYGMSIIGGALFESIENGRIGAFGDGNATITIPATIAGMLGVEEPEIGVDGINPDDFDMRVNDPAIVHQILVDYGVDHMTAAEYEAFRLEYNAQSGDYLYKLEKAAENFAAQGVVLPDKLQALLTPQSTPANVDSNTPHLGRPQLPDQPPKEKGSAVDASTPALGDSDLGPDADVSFEFGAPNLGDESGSNRDTPDQPLQPTPGTFARPSNEETNEDPAGGLVGGDIGDSVEVATLPQPRPDDDGIFGGFFDRGDVPMIFISSDNGDGDHGPSGSAAQCELDRKPGWVAGWYERNRPEDTPEHVMDAVSLLILDGIFDGDTSTDFANADMFAALEGYLDEGLLDPVVWCINDQIA